MSDERNELENGVKDEVFLVEIVKLNVNGLLVHGCRQAQGGACENCNP